MTPTWPLNETRKGTVRNRTVSTLKTLTRCLLPGGALARIGSKGYLTPKKLEVVNISWRNSLRGTPAPVPRSGATWRSGESLLHSPSANTLLQHSIVYRVLFPILTRCRRNTFSAVSRQQRARNAIFGIFGSPPTSHSQRFLPLQWLHNVPLTMCPC